MKKILFLFISLILVLVLNSCVNNQIINEATNETTDDGKQVPIYEGMTISSAIGDSSLRKTNYTKVGTFAKSMRMLKLGENVKDIKVESSDYYADLGEEIYITVHINNPDNFEILSFTLNGEKYSSYMFERGSNMETIVIKCNVGRESGEHNYTIDAIKYIDKSAIKDVVIRGNQTIKIFVSTYEHELNCKHDIEEKITIFNAKNPTCDVEGLSEGKKCELCNTILIEQQVLPKLECVPSDWIVDKEATTLDDGSKHTECIACGKIIDREVIDSISSEGLAYKVNDDGVSCTIIGIGTCTDLDVIIPKHIGDYKVTAIGENAFKECKSITSVVVSRYVSEIGKRAFMSCKAMNEVTLPAQLKIVGEEGFYLCDSLNRVYYQGNAEGWCAIDFGTGWSSPLGHGSQLYFGGELVTKLVIPDTVTKIDNHAFFGCGSITDVIIGNGVIEIGKQAFSACRLLSNVSLGDSVKIIDDCAFEYTQIVNIVIPDSVEYIGCEAFFYCESLKNVLLGNSVPRVGVGAFLGCSSLVYNEFDNALYFGNNENPYHLLVSAKDEAITSVKIHEKTKAIAGGAFSLCTALESVIIPNGVVVIGFEAFLVCTSLTNVVIPNSVTIIESRAFYTCVALKNVVISNSVTNIGNGTFGDCYALESINIPASVTNIGTYAFSNCGSLVEISLDGNNQYYKLIDGSLYTKDGKTLIRYVGNEKTTTYTIPDGVLCVAENAFSGCNTLISVVIPNSVNVIEDSAFRNCESLVSVIMPNSITRIEDLTFSGCKSLKGVILPNTVTFIGGSAFGGCTSLESMVIPESVTFIGDRAFIDCTSLTSIVIPKSVEDMSLWVFRDCTSLTIYCEAKSKPNGWNDDWNYSKRPVIWGYTVK